VTTSIAHQGDDFTGRFARSMTIEQDVCFYAGPASFREGLGKLPR
jgi:hypothetical protein